jgi:hypothetical protein
METLAFKPLVVEHPPEGMVTPENVSKYSAGTVGNEIIFDALQGFAKVTIVVQREDAIKDIETNLRRQFSPGYNTDIIEQAGEHPVFGRYDAIQTKRRYNHVALTDTARGGPELTMRLDSAIMTNAEELKTKPPTRTKRMATVNLDGVTIEVDDIATAKVINEYRKDAEDMMKKYDKDLAESKEAIGRFREQIAEMENQKMALENQIAEMKGQLEVLTAEPPQPEPEPEMGMDAMGPEAEEEIEFKMDSKKWFSDRVDLLSMAQQFRVDSADSMKNSEIRRAIVASYVQADKSKASAIEINAAFDTIKATMSRRNDSYTQASAAATQKTTTQNNVDSAREQYIARLKGAK